MFTAGIVVASIIAHGIGMGVTYRVLEARHGDDHPAPFLGSIVWPLVAPMLIGSRLYEHLPSWWAARKERRLQKKLMAKAGMTLPPGGPYR
jgi:hypothetical protein